MRFFLPVCILVVALVLPVHAFAATLSSVSSNNAVNVGDIFTLRIVANTEGKSINQSGATLHFPTDLLEVVSVSKGGSIFNLWVDEPAYSNVAGTVSYDGGVPNPGYTGSSGTIVSITIRAKKAGTATFSFSDAALRANDGFGTDILSGTNAGQISIVATTPVVPTTPVTPTTPVKTTTPVTTPKGAFLLTSSSHPNQDAWYSSNTPTLSWSVSKNATAVQTGISETEKSVPAVTYQPVIDTKTVEKLADGIWYFAVRERVGGVWSQVERYRLQIDSTPPAFDTPSFDYDATAQKLHITDIHAFDAHSGIANYDLSIDGKETQTIAQADVASGEYLLPFKVGGTHTVFLRVIDTAGNISEKKDTFTVPVPLLDQVLFTVFGIQVNVLWSLIMIVAISLLSFGATLLALLHILGAHRGTSKESITKREQLLHRALSVFKTDMEHHLKKLERAGSLRELTQEEKNIRENFGQNIEDLEKYLKKEFKKFD